MVLHRFLAALLAVVMATCPAWPADALGNVTLSRSATVRNAELKTGSTLFDGDAISVANRGTTRMVLGAGAQAEVLGSSMVRLAKSGDTTQLHVDHGQALLNISSANVEGVVGGVRVRAAGAAPASVVIQALSENHAIIAAQKGTLLVTTPQDGKTYTVREGQATDLTAMDATAEPQQGGAAPAGRAAPRGPRGPRRRGVFWVVALGTAGTAVAAYLLARGEDSHSDQILQDEISPTSLN